MSEFHEQSLSLHLSPFAMKDLVCRWLPLALIMSELPMDIH